MNAERFQVAALVLDAFDLRIEASRMRVSVQDRSRQYLTHCHCDMEALGGKCTLFAVLAALGVIGRCLRLLLLFDVQSSACFCLVLL